ncbi:hypothetical protein ACFQ4K_18250 [Tistrella bauzanensis]
MLGVQGVALGAALGADWLGAAAGLADARPWLRLAAAGIAVVAAFALGWTRGSVLPALRGHALYSHGSRRGMAAVQVLVVALIAWGLVAIAPERGWFDGISIMLILLIALPAQAAAAFLRPASGRHVTSSDPGRRGGPARPGALDGRAGWALRLVPLVMVVFAGYALLPAETGGSTLALPLLLVVTVLGVVTLAHGLATGGVLPDRINRITGARAVRVLAIILSVLIGLLVLAAIPTAADPASRMLAAIAGCIVAVSIAVALSLNIVHHPASFRRS